MSIDTCVCCGEEVPEGRQVCYSCEMRELSMSGKNPYFNNSGYPDPTAYDALKPIVQADNALEGKVNFLIKMLKFIISESGFELLNRIEIKDKRTGRTFK